MLATEVIGYSDRGTPLAGFLAFEDAHREQRPGLLLVHGGAGLDDHVREQALRYAAMGYIAFACDMYGSGVVGDREQVIAAMTRLCCDPDAMLRRGLAGLYVLTAHPRFDGRAAAVGFCFGGLTVLEFARGGMDLAGVVSIHGSLALSQSCAPGSIRARILICHGGRDPHVPLQQVTTFVNEMNAVGADCQVIVYANAWHGFTHKRPASGLSGGMVYDRTADRRSFVAVQTFLTEIFTRGGD